MEAAAAPTQEVQPCSRYFRATCAAQSVCSSGGITWMPSSEAALFQEKWVWDSVIPGIRVAPAPSMTVAPLVGIIGSVQAAEALKLLMGIGQPLVGRLLLLDALSMQWRSVRLQKDPACRVCNG